MILTFADKDTQEVYVGRKPRRFPPDILARAQRKLDRLDAVTAVEQLRQPPSNRLHALRDNRKGQWSIAVNMQWRICFYFSEGNAYDVELCDYH
jgi:proteic killer suppression protein